MSTHSYMMRAIAHVDADCFFAAVELLSRPDLRGKPLLVCNRVDRRGIVVSATYEARTFGIRAGAPVFQAKKLCPQGIFIPSHFERYEAASFHLMEILHTFSPDVEAYSIDEAFVDLTGLRLLYRTDYAGIGSLIQKAVTQKLGITVSVGIAASKLLAKIASDFKKPAGLTVVSQKHLKEFLRKIPLGDIPGIGPNSEALLTKFGLKTAFDVSQFLEVPHLLGKRGKELQSELNGMTLFKVERRDALPKSLSRTRTFPDFSNDRAFIFSFSLKLLLQLTRRLRSYALETQTFGFFLLTKDFRIMGFKEKLETPTDEDNIAVSIFRRLFDRVWRDGEIYRKSGFFFGDFRPRGPIQATLFENPTDRHLSAAIDKIHGKFGDRALQPGSLLNFS